MDYQGHVNAQYTEYPCDLCGSNEAVEVPYARLYNNNQAIHICKTCGLVYVKMRRTAEDIAACWSDELYGENYTARIPAVRARHIYVADFIDSSVGLNGKSLVDIGAGEGLFLKTVRDQYGAKVFGIEPSGKNCEDMKALGIACFEGTIEAYSGLKNEIKCDIITILWTLENCLSCKEMLYKANEILKEDGYLVVATGSRILVPFKKTLFDYHGPEPADSHCFRFSANTLMGVLAVCGFESVHVNRYLDSDYLVVVAAKRKKGLPISWKGDDYRKVQEFFERWHCDTKFYSGDSRCKEIESKQANDHCYIWKRESEFSTRERSKEKWMLEISGKSYEYDVDVRFGKKCDIASLKTNWPFSMELEQSRKHLDFFERAGTFIFAEECPVCSSEKSCAALKVKICGVDYLQCRNCGHVYATVFPSPAALKAFYEDPPLDNTYYVNPEEIDLRLKEIYVPKLEWIIDVYRKRIGRDPVSVLEFGSGAGHFLFGSSKRGLKVAGIEPDKASAQWCKEHFNIELCSTKDDLEGQKFDVVCSFNVIEHLDKPGKLLNDYKEFMHRESLAIIETPRAECITTALQAAYPDDPRGMIIPYEHNHLFSDRSLATLLFMNELAISNVWYFGQDIAELVFRICAELNADSSKVFDALYQRVQEAVDLYHASDLIMVAAMNDRREEPIT